MGPRQYLSPVRSVENRASIPSPLRGLYRYCALVPGLRPGLTSCAPYGSDPVKPSTERIYHARLGATPRAAVAMLPSLCVSQRHDERVRPSA